MHSYFSVQSLEPGHWRKPKKLEPRKLRKVDRYPRVTALSNDLFDARIEPLSTPLRYIQSKSSNPWRRISIIVINLARKIGFENLFCLQNLGLKLTNQQMTEFLESFATPHTFLVFNFVNIYCWCYSILLVYLKKNRCPMFSSNVLIG